MRDRPDVLEDGDIRGALAAGWEIDTTAMRYVPLGGGSYHWQVAAADGSHWFVSATDLDHAPWLGVDRESSWKTLEATMNTASTLRNEVGLSFVLAPVPRRDGETVRLVRQRYGLVVHPFLDGACGEFGAPLDLAEKSAAIDILAALHATPTAAVDLHPLVDLKARESLDPTDPAYEHRDPTAQRVRGPPRAARAPGQLYRSVVRTREVTCRRVRAKTRRIADRQRPYLDREPPALRTVDCLRIRP